jgi:hypothetical protein
MAHTSIENLSPAEREFAEFVQRGDDFYKIELLRHAKSWYKKALDLNFETEKINQKIEDCNKKLASERKITFILMAIAIIATLSYFLLFK